MKEITINDYEKVSPFLSSNAEYTCENTFVNLFVWGKHYKNQYKLFDDCFLIYSIIDNDLLFRLPFTENFENGFNKILELNDGKLPKIWSPEGALFDKFKSLYSDKYTFLEERNGFDYIYNAKDLAELSGKKYHSKRNHISSFSKRYNWEYKEITQSDIEKVLKCADAWYLQNKEKLDKRTTVERQGIELVLKNMEYLKVKCGAIFVEGEAVAFDIGSPINSTTFDIHFEKALSEYSEAYSVINREFVKNSLNDYQYINREDDLGLEGLRRAKLSYKPVKLLKKYLCIPKE